MKSQLLIPNKIKVGFNLRSDTYTGKLGYVIYHDGKVWRKETSWEGWRQKEGQKQFSHYETKADGTFNYQKQIHVTLGPEINPIEFENIPTEGFVLNKKAGGGSSGWNHRATYCRVYDPRGFEFEISIPNLLFILQETSSFKGKGLEGEFVYSWEGKDLVLIPTCCEDYKKSANFTKLQDGKVSAKDLIEGCAYKTKKDEELTYLGKFNWFDKESEWSDNGTRKYSKDYIFVDKKGKHINLSSPSILSAKLTDIPTSNYSELVDDLMKSKNITNIKTLESSTTQVQFTGDDNYYYYGRRKGDNADGTFEVNLDGQYFLEIEPNKFKVCNVVAKIKRDGYHNTKPTGYFLKANKVLTFDNGEIAVKPLTEKNEQLYSKNDLKNMSFKKLAIVTKGDKKYKLTV